MANTNSQNAKKGLRLLKDAVLVELVMRGRADSVELEEALFGRHSYPTQHVIRFVLHLLVQEGAASKVDARRWSA